MPDSSIDFAEVFNALTVPCAVLDEDLCLLSVNDAYCIALGRNAKELLGFGVFDAFPETAEREAKVRAAFDKALSGEDAVLEEIAYSIELDDDQGGGYRDFWWTSHYTPLPAGDDGKARMLLRVENVTELMTTLNLKDTIVGEMQHRIGNLLTLVVTMARQTARNVDCLEAFLPQFTGRVAALAETHSMLTGGNWAGMSLQQLVEKKLAAFGDGDHAGRIKINGPELHLAASEAQAISMALHELATNAAKYGAFCQPDGRLEVNWQILGETGFKLTWLEEGLGGVAEPTRSGFGSMILTTILPSQLNGTAQRSFANDCHSYTLTVEERMKRVD